MDPSKLSAQELLQRCLQSQDQATWLEFVRRFQPLITRVVIKSVRRYTTPLPSLVDDLVQETFVKLCLNNFRALRQFDWQHENALFGFLKRVASNVVHDYFRKKRLDEIDLDQIAPFAASRVGSHEDAERNLLIDKVKQCLATQAGEPNFTRDCTIFWLYYQQGLTAKAISELPAIGLEIKGVESALLRLTRLVREKMTGKAGSSGRAAASGG